MGGHPQERTRCFYLHYFLFLVPRSTYRISRDNLQHQRFLLALKCRDISIEIDDGSAMVNAMGAQKAKDYECLG
jgi:hypothetical protein